MKLKDVIKYTDKYRRYQYPSGRVSRLAMRYVRKTLQLYIQAEVISSSDNTKTYQVRLVFNQINYSNQRNKKCPIPYIDIDGTKLWIERPTSEHNILTRCQCLDFRHCFHWWDADHRFLLGPRIPYQRVPGSNRPPKNKEEIPGFCKHILTLIKKLNDSRRLELDTFSRNYVNRPKRKHS